MRRALQQRDPKTLSDEELAGICRMRPVVVVIEAVSSLGYWVSPVVLFVFCLQLASDSMAALPSTGALAALVGVLVLTHQLVRWPKRRYREELNYRELSQMVAHLEAMRCYREADWVLLFTASGNRRSSFWWLRLALKEGPPPSAQADLGILPERQPQHWVESEVSDDIVQEVLCLLKEMDLEALNSPSILRFDASISPACWWRLTVLRRDLAVRPANRRLPARPDAGGYVDLATVVSRDLPDLPAELLRHPTANACSKLRDIARRLSPER
jgi:hypothetical protein